MLATVKDAGIWGTGMANFQNYGASSLLSGFSGGPMRVFGLGPVALRRWHGQQGPAARPLHRRQHRPVVGRHQTHDWAEGNKTEALPGCQPGRTGHHLVPPQRPRNSTGSGTFGWGDALPTPSSDETNGDCYTHYDFSSAPAGIAFWWPT